MDSIYTDLKDLSMLEADDAYKRIEEHARQTNTLNAAMRMLATSDLFYLLTVILRRADLFHPFFYARCREVQNEPDGMLDLWAREHAKTSILTFGLTIFDILRDPEITFGIFSHTRPIAKAFLRTIMREFESNRTLHALFPDILYGTDTKQSPKWSEDDGIIVKRQSNPNEATIEAWGLVDGQPVSKHFRVLLYDDIVVQASVSTPEMIEKTMSRLEDSYSLGVSPGGRRRFAGTRWHFNDAYSTLIKRGTAKPRQHPGRIGGTEEGESVYWPEETHLEKRRDMGPYGYAMQILLNPKADALQGFKREWLRYYKILTPAQIKRMNVYILVDAANSKRKGSDYTSIWAIGLNTDKNYYALDILRDRLNLTERAAALMLMHRKYAGMGCNIKQVRYERYGIMADIDHIKTVQEKEAYRFDITEVGGITGKVDRIKRLVPMFEGGKVYLPESMHKTDYQKVPVDLINAFVEEEFMPFPVGVHDDMLDALARIAEPDLPLVWPSEKKPEPVPERIIERDNHTAWMT
jgi:predicted phage terminase large subunit-like protein